MTVHVYMFVSVHVSDFAYEVYVDVYVYGCACDCVCMRARVRVRARAYACVYACVCAHMYVHVYAIAELFSAYLIEGVTYFPLSWARCLHSGPGVGPIITQHYPVDLAGLINRYMFVLGDWAAIHGSGYSRLYPGVPVLHAKRRRLSFFLLV